MPPIYHFTHGSNLTPVLAAGELRAHSLAREETVVDIADSGVKAWRETREVTCGPGGCVGDYVPFYFAPRSPMLFKISRGGVDGVDRDQGPIVYLVSSTEAAVASGVDVVFTDGNAAKLLSDFYNDLNLLEEKVDWPLMATRYWHNTDEDGDRVRRRMAEFLVHQALPVERLTEIAVYGGSARQRVADILERVGIEIPITIRRDWYF